jgi:hypothetical protein
MLVRRWVSHHQNTGHNYDTKIGNRCFENVAQIKYLRTVTNQNLIQVEIKKRSDSGNACYHSTPNLFSSLLLTKKVKIKIDKTIILLVVL